MFKFNFQKEYSDEDANTHNKCPQINKLHWMEPKKVDITKETILNANCHEEADIETINLSQWKLQLKCLNSVGVKKNIEKTKLSFSTALSHSDLEPSIYEGGFKIWECTWDLLQHLEKADVNFKNKNVLELGCGAGILGIAAVKKGALVAFQDYNEEVLTSITIPNLLMNINLSKEFDPKNFLHTFYAGDWKNASECIMKDHKELFDVILTSETIYNTESHEKLLDVITNCLKPDGVVYLAAKTHYFGVGGGTLNFTNLVQSKYKFSVQTDISHEKGVRREVLTLKKT